MKHHHRFGSLILLIFSACSWAWTGPSDSEGKKLQKEFLKAQTSQLKALTHQQSLEMKELKETLKREFAEGKKNQRTTRKTCFDEHPKGADRRECVKKYIEEMKKLDSTHDSTLKNRRDEMKKQRATLLESQKKARIMFQQAIKSGTLPDETLWPPKGQ